MSKKKFGSHVIDGLNTRVVAHAIEDSELQRSVNVSYDAVGGATPLGEHELLYAGAGQENQGMASVVLNGTEHLFWRSGDRTFMDAIELEDVPEGIGTASFIGDGENVYIVDDSTGENYVYDGTYVRDHGAPAAPDDDRIWSQVYAREFSISAITNHATAPLVTSVLPINLQTGDIVYLRSLAGGTWATLDGASYAVTRVGTSQFTISADTSSLGSFVSGVVQTDGPAVGMGYMYAATTVVSAGGKDIESSLVRLWHTNTNSSYTGGGALNDLDPIIPATGESVMIYTALSEDPVTGYILPVTGVTYKLRIYRTKGDGADFYQLKDIESADLSPLDYQFVDSVKDSDLGALWLYSADANDQPPAGTMACICQQQMFMAGVYGNETNLYKSRISGYDYFKPTDYIDIEARITALVSMSDRVAVFTKDRIGTYSPIDEIGQFAWSLSPVGTDDNYSICPTDSGILFTRHDGLWIFDGVTSKCLTEHIDAEWLAADAGDTEWHVAKTNDMIICCSAIGTLAASTTGGKWRWTVVDDSAMRIINVCTVTGGTVLYGMNSGNVYRLFTGAARSLSITSKDYGGWKTWEALKLDVDASCGGNDFTATVATNHGESVDVSFVGLARRNRYRAMLPSNIRGEYVSIRVNGSVDVYGWELLAQ